MQLVEGDPTLTHLTGEQPNSLLCSLELLSHVEVKAGMWWNIWLSSNAGVPLPSLGPLNCTWEGRQSQSDESSHPHLLCRFPAQGVQYVDAQLSQPVVDQLLHNDLRPLLSPTAHV